MAAKTSSSSRCDACGENVGLWHAAFTSECAHTFHLRCVSGIGACPACAAQWKDSPAAAPAPPPATPFSFASTTGLFGQTSAASSPSASTMTGAFGVGQPPQAAASPFSYLSGAQATVSSFKFSGAPATASPFSIFSGGQATPPPRSLFGAQQGPPATPNPFWLGTSPPAAQSPPPPPPPSFCVCGGAMDQGQATVTSECAHTFHLRCFSGSVCPVCGARWRDEVTATPSPPPPPPPLNTSSSLTSTVPSSTPSFAPPSASSSSSPPESLFVRSAEFTFAHNTFSSSLSNPFSWPKFGTPVTTPSLAPPDPCSSPPKPSLFSSSAGFTLATPNPSSSPAFGTPSTTPSFETPDPSSSPSLFSSSAGFTFAPPSPSSSPAFNYTPGSPFTSSPPPPLFSGPPIFIPSNSSSAPQPPPSSTSFDDDEPVDPPAHDGDGQDAAEEKSGALVLTAHCESPAVARDAAHDGFAVLVHAKAAAAAAQASSARAPLDLVTVLDVSSSMEGTKLSLLKQAMGFVIDNLGPRDRLSIVTFSYNARRIIRLMRMSDGGKATARAAMESLLAGSLTNIGDGLRVAASVLDGRRHKNAVAGIILLSDGADNLTQCGLGPDGRKMHRDLVPVSLRRGRGAGGGRYSSPVHTFGFGTDHDAAAMQAVAEETGGTFSFVENQAAVQDSFAQCIGGLLTVRGGAFVL